MKESEIIELFNSALPASRDFIGIGDDCAVIRKCKNTQWLITTDSLVQNVHFQLKYFSPSELAKKSLLVSISDISAMGGQSQYALLSLCLPPDLDAAWIQEFANAFKATATEEEVILIGGDTTKSHGSLMINTTVVGHVSDHNLKLQSHAKPDDMICCTGPLGGVSCSTLLFDQ